MDGFFQNFSSTSGFVANQKLELELKYLEMAHDKLLVFLLFIPQFVTLVDQVGGSKQLHIVDNPHILSVLIFYFLDVHFLFCCFDD
jgi:hypothetical protein